MTIYNKYQAQVKQCIYELFYYWMYDAINPSDNEFYGEIDFYGNKKAEANKCIIMYSRILWSFSAAYNQYKDREYLKYAQKTYRFIKQYFYDNQFGGYYWDTKYDGTACTLKKQTYGQAFVLYSLAEYYIATQDKRVYNEALDLYNLIEQQCKDVKNGGYFEAFAQNWTKLDDVRLSEKDANEQKSMNTNLHVLEAYTRLCEAKANDTVRQSLKQLIEDFDKYIVGKDSHLILFFDENWTPKSNTISYGHDIEASWLLWEAVLTIGDKNLKEVIEKRILKIVEVFIKEGLDTDSFVYYEYFPDTKHLDTDRHWWTQVEAVEGLTNAYKLTSNKKYLEKAFKIWEFVFSSFPDNENGEWHWSIKKDGTPDNSKIKIGAWKTPYHSFRALMKLDSFLSKICE